HPDHNEFAIYAKNLRRDRLTSATKEPPSLHLMLSPKHADVVDDYLADLRESVEAVAAQAGAAKKADVRYS
ncbi:MAG: aspartate aminotransferase family protein, partial [Alphaproteobacteria bacterium]|nr:aspartate aminotransferase family protein [Alphaproteobacteria bacterium]